MSMTMTKENTALCLAGQASTGQEIAVTLSSTSVTLAG